MTRLFGTRLADDPQTHDEAKDPDRDVDEEDGSPADVLNEVSAERRTQREGETRDAGPDSDRLRALVGRERHRQDRQRSRHEQRTADALEASERDQVTRRAREAAHQRKEGEDSQAGKERALATVAVAEDAAGQHQARECEDVAVDDPLQAADAGMKVLRQPGESDVDDGVVEHRHEKGEAAGKQNQDLLALVVAFEHGLPRL